MLLSQLHLHEAFRAGQLVRICCIHGKLYVVGSWHPQDRFSCYAVVADPQGVNGGFKTLTLSAPDGSKGKCVVVVIYGVVLLDNTCSLMTVQVASILFLSLSPALS